MKKGLSIILALIMVVSTMACLTTFASASYDSMSTARNVTFGTTYSGSITVSDTADFYKIVLNNSSTIKVNVSSLASSNYVYLFDANGNQMWYNYPSAGSSGITLVDETFIIIKGTYYFKISNRNNSSGTYELKVTATSANETFPETAGNMNNTIATADMTSSNVKYYGQIASNDSEDFYKITLNKSAAVSMNFIGAIGSVYLHMFDVNGGEITYDYPSAGSSGEISFKKTYWLVKGDYYFKVSKRNGNCGNYNFEYSVVNSNESFVETKDAKNDTMQTANIVSFGANYIGQIAFNDRFDFYRFDVSAKSKVKLNFTGYAIPQMVLFLFNSDGEQLNKDYVYDGSNGDIVFNEVYDLDKGTYYLKFEQYSGHGNYSFSLSKYVETPKAAAANQTNGIKVSWNTVSGATKYVVFRRQAGTSAWVNIGTTTNAYLLDKNVANGKYYAYSIRAYDANGSYSAYESGKTYTAKFVATPKMTGISNATNGVYVKWSAVPGAVEYRVYRRGAGSYSWKYLGSTKSLGYTDTGVRYDSGDYYRYTVRAVSSYFSGFDANGLVIKRLENPSLRSATSSKSGITVKWSSVEGTTGYYVYRKTAGSSWTCLGSVGGTNNTTYLDRGARKGVTYYYTVRACYGKTVSSFNSGISCYDKY